VRKSHLSSYPELLFQHNWDARKCGGNPEPVFFRREIKWLEKRKPPIPNFSSINSIPKKQHLKLAVRPDSEKSVSYQPQ